jgi:hypothetical protein
MKKNNTKKSHSTIPLIWMAFEAYLASKILTTEAQNAEVILLQKIHVFLTKQIRVIYFNFFHLKKLF